MLHIALSLVPVEYMTSKSESTPFCIEATNFSCDGSVFAATATAGNLQATNFAILTFTNQKNGIS